MDSGYSAGCAVPTAWLTAHRRRGSSAQWRGISRPSPSSSRNSSGRTGSSGRTSSRWICFIRSWPYSPLDEPLRSLVNQLKDEVRAQDLWAAHLDPELGGKGYGQLKLALLNEILGRSGWAPIVFGCAAPDTGNAEIIAAYGTPEQKERYLEPLLEGECFSSYSMTEPQGGSDPEAVQVPGRARRRRVGDQRRQVLLVEPSHGAVPHRHGGDEPRRVPLPGHVDVPGAVGHARDQRPAPPRPRQRGLARRQPRPCPIRERARPNGQPARRRRERLSRSRSAASAEGAFTTPCAPSPAPRRCST